MPTRRPVPTRIAAATLLLAAGLVVVGWFDYRATRQDLLTLMIDQAASLRQAVAAAARSAEAATAQVQATMTARLLDNARLLDQIDRRGGLTQSFLDSVTRQHRLFRVTVFSASGARILTSGLGGPPPWAGRGGLGAGGARSGEGPGGGGGAGFGNATADRLLAGSETETASEVHGSRWGNGWRLSAGIRRFAGGAIVLNVDAADIVELQRQASIDHLLADIAARAGEIAYVILVDASARSAHGRLADAALARADSAEARRDALPLARELADLTAYELDVDGHPVLEFRSPVDSTRQESPLLRLGLSLDGLHAAERRSLTRLVLLLLAALGLGGLTIAFVGLRHEHGALREQHARAQEALRRRDRLAAMGELASTVAHEVRNPLNAIGMSVQRLRREFLDAPPEPDTGSHAEQRELLDILSSETSRINRIVQQFLEFARPPQLSIRRVDLAALLADVAASAGAMAATRGITLDTTVDGAGEAVVDPDQLRQALDNILRNAIDASPTGSVVALHATGAGHGHRIVIEDHGPGIAADHLPRIFDLYFTTKADGTGVGLAVTHQIVEAHGGTVEVDTELGRGTRMIINLPSTGEAQAHG